MAAALSPAELKVSFDSNAPEHIDGGRFTGVLDISAFDAGEGDVLAVRAKRDSDAVVPHTLTAQTIRSIDQGNALVAGPEDTRVTLDVVDQDRRPVVGAEVRRSSDGTLVGYTDVNGQVTASQRNSATEATTPTRPTPTPSRETSTSPPATSRPRLCAGCHQHRGGARRRRRLRRPGTPRATSRSRWSTRRASPSLRRRT